MLDTLDYIDIRFLEIPRPKRLMPCRKCCGQILKRYEEYECLQCGAPHNPDGTIILTVVGTKKVSNPRHNFKRRR